MITLKEALVCIEGGKNKIDFSYTKSIFHHLIFFNVAIFPLYAVARYTKIEPFKEDVKQSFFIVNLYAMSLGILFDVGDFLLSNVHSSNRSKKSQKITYYF